MKLRMNKLINILLESRQLRIAAKRAEVNESFIELSQKIEDLGLYTTKDMVSSQIDSTSHIMEALEIYCNKLPRKSNPRDLKACIELVVFFEEKKNWIATNPDGLQERIDFYMERTEAQIRKSEREDIRRIYFDLGNQAFHSGDWNAAIRFFDKAQKMLTDPDPNIEYNKACVLDAAPNIHPKIVIKAYTAAAELLNDQQQKKSPKTENNRGVIIASRFEDKNAKSKEVLLEQSIKSFKKAIDAEPSCFEAHYNLGRIYNIAGDSEKSVEYLEKAIKIKPSADIHNLLAVEYFKLYSKGDEKQANDYLENAKKHAKAYVTSMSERMNNKTKL